MLEARHYFPNESRLSFAESQTGALKGADALIIVTEWRALQSRFRHPQGEVEKPGDL